MPNDKPASPPGLVVIVEILRGLAALSVAWFHITATSHSSILRASGSYAWLGVDVFFVISGFVIPYALIRQAYVIGRFPQFLARRLVRLEPPYLASIALCLALGWLSTKAPGFQGPPFHMDGWEVAAHFLYLIPLTPYHWINIVYWSLAYEFVFYLSAGLLWPWLVKRNLLFTLALFLLAAGGLQLITGHVPDRLFLFLFGIAAARYFVGIDKLPMFLVGLACAAVATGILSTPASAIAGLATALVVVFAKPPRLRLLSGLGAISYSLYLLHVPIGGRVMNLGMRVSHAPLYETALAVGALALSLLCAVIFWKMVEMPAHRLSQRLFAARTPAPEKAA